MRSIRVEFDIRKPPADVFAFLTDFSQLTRWRSIDEIRLEPEGAMRTGTKLHSRVAAMGQKMTFVNEVTQLDPKTHAFRDKFLSGSFPIQSGWQVQPVDGGSRIIWDTQFQPRGIMRLLPFLLASGIRRGQKKDLLKLKQILEATA